MSFPDLSGYNDHQLIAWVLGAFLLTLGGLLHVVIKLHSTDKNAKAANDQTVPTGNGFAQRVRDDLKDIKDSIADLAMDMRADNARLEHRLDEHMNNHDRRSPNA